MRVAYRAGKRIGRVGLRHPGQLEQPHDHVLHLFLACMAIADNRLLDLQRRVFVEHEIVEHDRADRRAARLAEHQRRLRIDVDEHFFERDLIGPIFGDDLRQPIEQQAYPRSELAIATLDAAARDVMQALPGFFDYAKAGTA